MFGPITDMLLGMIPQIISAVALVALSISSLWILMLGVTIVIRLIRGDTYEYHGSLGPQLYQIEAYEEQRKLKRRIDRMNRGLW